ncbi:MAG: hypothetical protein JGK17_10100 [Microcoleus sp. PH2017_10_PVI_O_A]|uniref:hypothetical protein n=1 Tax=unclassified Microcoleus TaxID=2642155 RepID=UPI001D1F9BD9|nr:MULTISPECIES: hypothetical protein [unclassified Microcoleus]TAE83729.1 MAG: hypothetical protein EAZ83_08400 [Oscillatoriales cyanobacterium]MCC3405923.1 hypothetical protein [Microcoleus sp. PH2017_10_PVI_O_A]MCC3459986.1 hypothetical protein [Microcoleus sp. PH2017_11_PCY_U_A]MCC3478500.1 hypothetical protein [Microcoleus sp. PH2017_12_PCY_D_A]MCC3559352.1 hypothetical protein [Microcoleus sp. PH2017_27_LUM_O_A]
MKAYEFPAKVTDEGKIEFPDTLLKYLAANQEVRVIVLVEDTTDTEEENAAWHRLAAEQLLAGYSEEDAIYDNI